MPVYVYKGVDVKGKPVTGFIEADNAKVARIRLRKQNTFPTEVKEQVQGATRGSGLNVEIDFSKYLEFISPRDISQMTQQLATMVGASIPMVEALSALIEQTEKNKLKVVLSQVKEKVNEGATLADAMQQHPKVFPNLYVQMVRAGERSGALDDVLERLSTYAESQVKMQGKVASALIYPVLMSIVGSSVLLALFVFVIPKIRATFTQMGGEETLPLPSVILFFIGDMVLGYWWAIPLIGIPAIFGFYRLINTPWGRERWDTLKLRAPIFGRVNKLVAVSRFCRTLGTLLVSGVPILGAMEIARNVVDNVIIARAIDKATANISEGQSIAVPLRTSGEFPPLVTHMIAVGEKTGELEKMLNSVSNSYDDQVETALEAMTSLLGPLIIISMGAVIFFVALGLLLPMQAMMRNIH